MKKKFFCLTLAVFFLFLGAHHVVASDSFPNKPIKFIIGGKSGDAYDINGRKFAQGLSKQLGVEVLPINALGPMSVDFFESLNDSEPDGYTLGFGGAAHRIYHMLKPGRLTFDIAALPIVAGMNTFPDLVWASAKSKTHIQTAEDLLNYKGPIRINLFSPILVGVCSLAITAQERHLDLRPVVYDSFPEGHVAMIRGDCDVGTTTASGSPLKFIKAGQYVPLFVWGDERFAPLPDTPCSRELGLNQDLEGTMQQRVFLAPPGTPADRIAVLEKAIKAMLSDPEIVKWGNEANQPLFFMPVSTFAGKQEKLMKFYKGNIDAIKPFLK